MDEVVAALRRAGAVFAFLHGSRAAGTHRPDSDVDVAAWWGTDAPQSFELELPDGVDLLVLDHAPLELAGRVAVDGVLLFDDDPPGRVRWEATTRKIYFDEQPRLLRVVTDEVGVLRAEASAGHARRSDPMWLRGVKYSFVASIEDCIDAGQHVCSSEGWGPPRNNGDVMRVLADHGVLGVEHGRRMAQAAGFRNVLVHDYIEVDDDVVLARLADLSDLEAFVAALAGLTGQP